MSLKVPDHLLSQAQNGELTDQMFLECIRTSLPYAWSVVERLADKLAVSSQSSAEDNTAPPTQEDHAQLLRLVGSDAMRNAVEKHYGMRLAFQNCCKVGLFRPEATDEHTEFTSARAQLLNQAPALINC